MAQLFGRARVTVDGQQLLVDNDAKLNLGGVNRNTVKGTAVYGYAEETMEATVECSVFVDGTTDLDALNATSDATIQFACDTGQQYVLAHAWLTKPVEAASAKDGGKVKLSFAASSAERVA